MPEILKNLRHQLYSFREVLPYGEPLCSGDFSDPGVHLPAGYTYLPQEATNPDTGETSFLATCGKAS